MLHYATRYNVNDYNLLQVNVMKAELITIGNEILLGDVMDSNAYFLAGGLTSLGVNIVRMHTIRDSIEEIVKFLDYTLNHDKADIVITTGGLGPTMDDMTFEGVAKFFDVELLENPRSLLYLQERVDLLNIIDPSRVRKLIPARMKMALLPCGGVPLYNPNGAAPGLWYELDGRVLICLPGVPAEMKGIWEVAARPRLEELTHGFEYQERHYVVHFTDESALAPIIAYAMAQFPEVHFKTRPKRAGSGWKMKLDIAQLISPDVPSRLQKAVDSVLSKLEEKGIGFDLREENK